MRLTIGDPGEMIRFLLTGGIATLGNMAVVWLTRAHLPLSASIGLGLITGMIVSFLMMKFFAFRSSGWSGAKGEMLRFLCVYAGGAVVYFIAALATEHVLSNAAVPIRWAAIGAVLVGGMLMAMTSYVGHKHFTYRVVAR